MHTMTRSRTEIAMKAQGFPLTHNTVQGNRIECSEMNETHTHRGYPCRHHAGYEIVLSNCMLHERIDERTIYM